MLTYVARAFSPRTYASDGREESDRRKDRSEDLSADGLKARPTK